MRSPPPHPAKFPTRPNVNTIGSSRCTRLGSTDTGLARHLPECPTIDTSTVAAIRENLVAADMLLDGVLSIADWARTLLSDAIGLVDDVVDAAEGLIDDLKAWASSRVEYAFVRVARVYLEAVKVLRSAIGQGRITAERTSTNLDAASSHISDGVDAFDAARTRSPPTQ